MNELPIDAALHIDRMEQHFVESAEYADLLTELGYDNVVAAMEELLSRIGGRPLLLLLLEIAGSVAYPQGFNATSLQYALIAAMAYREEITPDDVEATSGLNFQDPTTFFTVDPASAGLALRAACDTARAVCRAAREVGRPESVVLDSTQADADDWRDALAAAESKTRAFSDAFERHLADQVGAGFDINALVQPYIL